MKKTLAMILALTTAISVMAGCGGGAAAPASSAAASSGASSAAAAPAAPAAKQLTVQEQSKARFALGQLINREELVTQVTQGGQVAANGFYPKALGDGTNADVRASDAYGTWYTGTATPSAVNANLTEDQATALQTLIDLGYAYTGTIEAGDIMFTNMPTVDFAFNNSGANALIIQYIQETWNRFGIPSTINTEAWATLQDKLKKGDAEAARMGWIADFNDVVNFLEIFISASGNNYPRLGRDLGEYTKATETTKDAGMGAYWGLNGDQTWAEAYDAVVDQIKATTDPAERVTLAAQAEQVLMATGGAAPLYYYTNPNMKKPTVKDLISLSTGDVLFTYASVEGKEDISIMLGGGTPLSLDPALNSASTGSNTLRAGHVGLMGYQWVDGKPTLSPELAESYTVSDDKKVYTFTLREGLKWSDGSDFTVTQLADAWKRAASADLGADYGFMFNVIAGFDAGELNVVADDAARTFTVTLNAPTPYFLDLCAFPTFFPVKTDVADAEGVWATNPETYIGMGPFRMTKYSVDDVISYEKNPNYWNADQVKLTGINYYLSEDNTAILTAYETDTVQYIESIDPAEFGRLQEQYPGELVFGDYIGTYYVLFNVHKDLSPVA